MIFLRTLLMVAVLCGAASGCTSLLYFGAGAIGSVLQLCESREDEQKERCK